MRFILEARGDKSVLDPLHPYGAFVEDEPDGLGGIVPVATVLLTNRECPWRCVFCDLWKNTLDATVPPGAIEAQLKRALANLPPARWIKLYNAGSFFDPRAIPVQDVPAIADLLAPFERVIVESHPALVEGRVQRLRNRLPGRLEVAMGLETVHPTALERLNKGMTLEDFARAAEHLRREGVDLRAFVLVQPPFTSPDEAVDWSSRSIDFARECGARLVALIPTRGGNGAMEALRESGDFTPPRLSALEEAFDRGLEIARSRAGPLLVVDLWELERFSTCSECFSARRQRLHRMNLMQTSAPRVPCSACGAS